MAEAELRGLWQWGAIICFMETFDVSMVLTQSSFTFCPKLLRRGITAVSGPDAQYLEDLMVGLLRMHNRLFKTEVWEKTLARLMDKHFINFRVDGANPLSEGGSFVELPVRVKVLTLSNLCHFLLSSADVFRKQIPDFGPEAMRGEAVFGTDEKGACYRLFQRKGSFHLYKESPPKFNTSTAPPSIASGGDWEIVACDTAELEAFAASISASISQKSSAKKYKLTSKLLKELLEVVIPASQKEDKARERRKRSGLDASLILETTSVRSSRNKPVSYADDYDWADDY